MSNTQSLTAKAAWGGLWRWLFRNRLTLGLSRRAAVPSKLGLVGTTYSFGDQDRRLPSGIDDLANRASPSDSCLGLDLPITYLVLGSPADRRAFALSIQAFDLAGRLGDRLTLVGYGRYQRRLQRWSTALGIDAAVAFAAAEQGPAIDCSAFDVTIILSQRPASPYMPHSNKPHDITMGFAPAATDSKHRWICQVVIAPCNVRTMVDAMLAARQHIAQTCDLRGPAHT
jgi:hypothetical protein